MENFIKHKIVILRTIGAAMLLIGFVIHFWATPKEGLSKNDIAARNVARMEAKATGSSSSGKKSVKKDDSKFLNELKSTQAKQMRYLTIIAMILGVGSLGYSFVKKKET